MGNLASTYHDQGKFDEAEQLEVQVLDMRKKLLGAEHPDTLSSMGNLASTYHDQGKFDEAEQLEVQVLDMRKKATWCRTSRHSLKHGKSSKYIQ
jgi:hypothetical protein